MPYCTPTSSQVRGHVFDLQRYIFCSGGTASGVASLRSGPLPSVMQSMQCGAVGRSCWPAQRGKPRGGRLKESFMLCLHLFMPVAVRL